jgi:hypothetical protein
VRFRVVWAYETPQMVRVITTSKARFSNQNFEDLKRRVMVTPFQKINVFTTNR